MASYVPPKKSTAFIMYCGLPSATNASTFQSNPTLASGDAKVSIDGGSLANLTTLPTVTPSSSKVVKISLSTSEMAGDNVTVVLSDQTSPPEWADVVINIQTSAVLIDDLNTKIDTIDTNVDSVLVDTGTTLPSTLTTIEGKIDTVDSNVDAILVDTGTDIPATLTTISGKVDTVDTVVDSIQVDTNSIEAKVDTIDTNVDAILVDTGTTLDGKLTTLQTSVDDLPTNSELTTALGTLNDLSEADVRTAVGLSSANLDTQLADIDSDIAAIDIPTVSEVADAVWDEDLTGHTTVGSAGDTLSDAGAGGTPPTADAIADEVATRTLNANITKVNNINVTGQGTSNDPWGPSS